MSLIIIHEPAGMVDEDHPLLSDVSDERIVCRGAREIFEALARGRPALLVYVLENPISDLPLLAIVRRLDPTLPIILLSRSSDLDVRRSVQPLKPVYFGVLPLDPSELGDAVRAALDHLDGKPIRTSPV